MKIVHLRKGIAEMFPLGGSGSEGRNWRSFLRFVREGQSCGQKAAQSVQILKAYRFDQERECPQLAGELYIMDGFRGGQDDHRQAIQDGLLLAEPFEHLKTVYQRHDQVEQQQTGHWKFGTICELACSLKVGNGPSPISVLSLWTTSPSRMIPTSKLVPPASVVMTSEIPIV